MIYVHTAVSSMGSIVAQAFIAVHGHRSETFRLKGFLNLDGLPYPFINEEKLFYQAAMVYHIYGYILWTGKSISKDGSRLYCSIEIT